MDAAALSLDGVGEANADFAGVMSAESAKQSPRGWLAVVADGVSSARRGNGSNDRGARVSSPLSTSVTLLNSPPGSRWLRLDTAGHALPFTA